MKFRIALLLLAAGLAGLDARKLPLDGGGSVDLAEIVVLSPAGLRMVKPGSNEVLEIAWDKIDLEALARTAPDLDRMRQRVILLDETKLIEIEDLPNYYAEFLNAPVNIRFNQEFKTVRRASSAPPVVVGDEAGGEAVTVFTTGNYIETRTFSEETRPDFESTVEGLLTRMSDHRTSRSRRLIRDLVEHQEIFSNLLLGLRNLAEVYPDDYRIGDAIEALDNFASDPSIDTRDQERLARFVEHARKQG